MKTRSLFRFRTGPGALLHRRGSRGWTQIRSQCRRRLRAAVGFVASAGCPRTCSSGQQTADEGSAGVERVALSLEDLNFLERKRSSSAILVVFRELWRYACKPLTEAFHSSESDDDFGRSLVVVAD